jgi:hypothetical protein
MSEIEYPNLELNGKVVTEYQTDIYGMSDEELDPADLLFNYAEFENGRELTDNQLIKLSKKYKHVLYLLVKDDLPEDSPHHVKYQAMLDTV